jgi:hypothetical protein
MSDVALVGCASAGAALCGRDGVGTTEQLLIGPRYTLATQCAGRIRPDPAWRDK